LRALLFEDDERYRREAESLVPTTLDRLAENRRRLQQLRERKENERLAVVQQKYLQQAACVRRTRRHLANVTSILTETTHTHTHPFNGPFSGTTRVGRYQKGKTNLDFTEAIDSEWQWHQLGHMQVCTSLQTDNHASTSPLSFFTGGSPTNSIKALKARLTETTQRKKNQS